MWFAIVIALLIIQRISELIISRNNEKWLKQNGAVEYGQRHYPFIVMLHVFFIISLLIEYFTKQQHVFHAPLFIVYALLILLKTWVIASLGKYWNTKIFRVPGKAPVTNGAYKFIKHPNYIIVIGEIAVIPLIFNLYFTVIIFSILNAVMLNIRIRKENRVWNVK